MKQVLILPLALFGLGCAAFAEAQSGLVAQARRGIELAESNRAGAAGLHAQLAKLKRQRLDEAFDADVRALDEDLTAEWVIRHRVAYVAALDAYATQHAEQGAADEVARQNLRAIDAALERLSWLQSIQSTWRLLPEEQR